MLNFNVSGIEPGPRLQSIKHGAQPRLPLLNTGSHISSPSWSLHSLRGLSQVLALSTFVASKRADARELRTYLYVAKQAITDTVSDLMEPNDSTVARASTSTNNDLTRDLELNGSVLMIPMTWKIDHSRVR